ncbi:hypothetical protein [Nocardia sp. NPDC047038]|uniref:hypothetical protein n=1 Tax=Nocardia sp. NPDC047038 TaxID=3154338 RepID=UPI0033C04DF0
MTRLDDPRRVVSDHLDLDDAALATMCERAVRNYDPCISCSAHFLDRDMVCADDRAVGRGRRRGQ